MLQLLYLHWHHHVKMMLTSHAHPSSQMPVKIMDNGHTTTVENTVATVVCYHFKHILLINKKSLKIPKG
jgi:hypothetical protein